MTKKTFSLSDLDATAAGSKAHEFEFLNDDGEGTGIFFSVYGAESEQVTSETARLINERRKREAIRVQNNSFRNKKNVEFDSAESDIEFGQRVAAVRLAGWRGISDEFNAENALTLCKTNRKAAAQIVEQSDNSGNFTIL